MKTCIIFPHFLVLVASGMGYLVYLREGPHKRRCTAGMGTTSPSVMVTSKKTHVCNRLCRKMKLRPVSEYDFIPPKAVVQFPGVSEAFLRTLTAETLKTVRAKYGLAEPWHRSS